MSNEKILSRIRKLIAMASDDRGNDNERETALRQAHALLTKHGLEMQDVAEFEREKLDPRGRFDSDGWSMIWTHQIRNSIAQLFMCRYYTGKKINGTKQGHIFVGRESNATTAMYMSAYVVDSVLREGRKLYKHNLSAETRVFALGVASALHQRIGDMIREQTTESETTPGTALAVVNMIKSEAAANLAFVEGWRVTRGRRGAGADHSSEAFANGVAYGQTVNLNRQVTGASRKLLA